MAYVSAQTAVFRDTPGYSAQVIAGGISCSVHNETDPLRAYSAALLDWLDAEWEQRFSCKPRAVKPGEAKPKHVSQSRSTQHTLFSATPATRAGQSHTLNNSERAGQGRSGGRRQAAAACPPSVLRGAN